MYSTRVIFSLAFTLAGLLFLNLIIFAMEEPRDLNGMSIIPKPLSVASTGSFFTIGNKTTISVSAENAEIRSVAEKLAAMLRPLSGFQIAVESSGGSTVPGSINFAIDNSLTELGSEGYRLVITAEAIHVRAAAPAGLFYAVQTIRQLLPAEVEAAKKYEATIEIPTGTITDYPVYGYRGSMLDVSRHFFSVSDVKRYIDFLAAYKMNKLHLHLSDDQGWRIEIKSWPDLTVHGGKTEVGGGEGGFFTQAQYRDLVYYAKSQYVTIIPEIDMPGHTNAALASYAELNVNKAVTKPYTGTAVGFSTLDTKSEATYRFITDVIGELAELTPGEYIHIGGDESNSTLKADYIQFMNRVQDIVASHGKKVIAWDEVALTTMKPGTIAQVWANVKNATLAVSQGAKVLMSPAKRAYLDMQYHKDSPLGLHWAGYIEVDTAYNWEPSTYIAGIKAEHVIGLEAPLWSETVTNIDEVEFMVFPRLPGYAEIGWTPASMRKWEEYKFRLASHGARFTAAGINYYPSARVPWPVKN